MKNISRVLWGVLLIAAGVLFALNALDVTDIDVFFDGWWTLFIIVPCTVGLFTEREKTGNIVGIVIGVLLLLACRDVLAFDMLWKLLVPALIILIGARMVFGAVRGNKAGAMLNDMKENGKKPRVSCATFSSAEMKYEGEVFEGAEVTAVFGGVECDLRGAIFEGDCALEITAIFGGVDILVPDNVNVKVNSRSVFGGISNKTQGKRDGVTLYISGTCLFGGVDIQ